MAKMSTKNIEPIARAICEHELRSMPGGVIKGELPALLDRYWPVIAAEIPPTTATRALPQPIEARPPQP